MQPTWAALAAVMLGLLLPLAAGQALDPAVAVEADAGRVDVPHDGDRTVAWTVRNDGPLQVTVALALELDGPWSTDFGQRYGGPFTLPSGGERVLSLRVSPTTATTDALADGAAVLVAEATDGSGRTAQASDSVTLGYLPAPAPVVPPPDHTLRNSLLGAGAGLVLLVAGYAAFGRLVTARAPVREVAVLSDRHGRSGSGWVRFQLRNRAPWDRTVRVRLRSDDEAVLATTDADQVRVSARGRSSVTLHVRSRSAEPTRVVLEARTRGQPWRRVASVRVVRAAREPSPFEAPLVAEPGA